ncbi:hypothetical protein AKJ16_DCAP19141 [Drosera capensis]
MAISGSVVAAVTAASASIAIGGTVATTKYVLEREHMKHGDRKIEEERLEERRRDSRVNTLPQPDWINHDAHPQHPLKTVHWKEHTPFHCHGCEGNDRGHDSLVYRCDDCNFNLHRVCSLPIYKLEHSTPADCSSNQEGTAAVVICMERKEIETFAHQNRLHPVRDVYKNTEFRCRHCNTTGRGRRYRCEECDVDYHSVCAEHPTRLLSFLHPEHELELKTKPHKRDCDICGDHTRFINCRVYRCKNCKVYFHPGCCQLPQYLINLRLHDKPHYLQLKKMFADEKCDVCKKKCGKWRYYCEVCNVHIHAMCMLKGTVHGMYAGNKEPIFIASIQLASVCVRGGVALTTFILSGP